MVTIFAHEWFMNHKSLWIRGSGFFHELEFMNYSLTTCIWLWTCKIMYCNLLFMDYSWKKSWIVHELFICYRTIHESRTIQESVFHELFSSWTIIHCWIQKPCMYYHLSFMDYSWKKGWWPFFSGVNGCAFNWWSGGCRFDPRKVGNILPWRLIMKSSLWSFSPFCWFKKGRCQFPAKECAQCWLIA